MTPTREKNKGRGSCHGRHTREPLQAPTYLHKRQRAKRDGRESKKEERENLGRRKDKITKEIQKCRRESRKRGTIHDTFRI